MEMGAEVLADAAITTSVFAYYFINIKGKRKATPTSDAGDVRSLQKSLQRLR